MNSWLNKQILKVQAAGQYDLNKNLINIKNDVFIKTKNLTIFQVLLFW